MSESETVITVGPGTYYPPDLKVLKYDSSEDIVIGKYCSIAHGVTLFCGGGHRTDLVSTWPFDVRFNSRTNLDSRTYKGGRPTVIGNDVWIAQDATIMVGLTIGHGAVIGPGAVVFEDVPPYAVMRGNPAALHRYRHRRWVIEALLKIAWWDWDESLLRERCEDFYGPAEKFVEKYQ